jgi:hypothetical protein
VINIGARLQRVKLRLERSSAVWEVGVALPSLPGNRGCGAAVEELNTQGYLYTRYSLTEVDGLSHTGCSLQVVDVIEARRV